MKLNRRLIRRRSRAFFRAFTLIEMVLVVSIVAILIVLAFPAFQKVREKAEGIVCMGHLRGLHVALNAYVQDHKQWPQTPDDVADQTALAGWWIDTLAPYNNSKNSWHCPTFDRRYKANPAQFSDNPRIHYVPTQFDDKPLTPFRWSTMPWLIEIGDFHGNGNLMIFPDGSIRTIKDVFYEQTGEKWQ